MTRILLRITLLLLAGSALLVAVMGPVGSQLPARALPEELGFASCELPCWGTITPGETPFNQAGNLLQRVLPRDISQFSISPSQINFWTRSTDQDFSGFLYYGQGRVGYVRLYVAVPAAYLLDHLGTPDCVWLETAFPGQDILIVYWEQVDVLVGAMFLPDARGGFRPGSRTSNLWMSSTDEACLQDRALPWMGFAPIERYRELQSPLSARETRLVPDETFG